MPDTSANDLGYNWVRISDFSPGIQQRTNFTGAITQPAQQQSAATRENTFRCVALPNGGLGPLPAIGQTYQPAVPDTHTSTNTYSGYACVGFFIASFIDTSAHTTFMEFHIAYEWINNFGGAQRRFRWQRHRTWDVNGFGPPAPTIDTVKSINSASANTSGGFIRCSLCQTRMDPTTDTNPGIPVIVGAWQALGEINEKFWSIFPSPAAPGVIGTFDISTDLTTNLSVKVLCSHQNRSVAACFTGYTHPNSTWAGNDNYFWTNANLPTLDTTVAQVFGSDTYSGTVDMASTNASQLFILKPMRGGAIVVSGDLDNPTVSTLPGVNVGSYPSVGGSYTPFGFLFFSLFWGAYIWSGGDQAQQVAAQLDADFFFISNDPHAGGGDVAVNSHMQNSVGNSINWGNYVAVANNWLYDSVGNAWWRLDDPSNFQLCWLQTSMYEPFAGWLWGATNFYDGSNPLVYGFDPATPVTNYRWQSQPIEATQGQLCNTRKVILTAQGEGTIVVTLEGLGDVTETTTFNVPAGNVPTQLMANSNLKAQRIQIQVDATGTGGFSPPAPIIYDVGFAFEYVEQIPSQ